jgi:hypothetical protein
MRTVNVQIPGVGSNPNKAVDVVNGALIFGFRVRSRGNPHAAECYTGLQARYLDAEGNSRLVAVPSGDFFLVSSGHLELVGGPPNTDDPEYSVDVLDLSGESIAPAEPRVASVRTTANNFVRGAADLAGTSLYPTDAADGVYLREGVSAIRVYLHPADAATLNAGGTLQAYVTAPGSADWMRCPALDLTVDAAGAFAGAGVTWPEIPVSFPTMRVCWAPSGVTTSSAGTVNVDVDSYQPPNA